MNNLVEFLYPALAFQAGFNCPQIAETGNKGVLWSPGKRDRLKKQTWLENPSLLGFGPRIYQNYTTSRNNQPYLLAWTALDIDEIEVAPVLQIIQKLIPDCSIRLSKSKKGLHVFFRFEQPLYFHESEHDLATQKEFLKPYIKLLTEHGIHICTAAPSILWLSGEKHTGDFLYTSPKKLECKKVEYLNFQPLEIEIGCHFKGKMFDLLTLLHEAGAIIAPWDGSTYGIYMRAAYGACKGTEFEFKTESPMVNAEAHNNGYLFMSSNTLCLRGSKDSENCLVIEEYAVNQ